ncbi:MAG: hypothetical protein JXR86_18825 [Spirochaetales bacterium]|nr:hypothetical protein [Spirochaetales bacterium]
MESTNSVFDKLAAELPPDERKSLLKKINNSLKLNESSEDFKRKEFSREDVEKRVRRDINLSNWFERLIIRLYTFFTGKNPVDFYLGRSLKQLRKRLNNIPGGSYFAGDEMKLSGRLAGEIYDLYVLVAPLRRMFKEIWLDTEFIEALYSTFIRESIHSGKSEIYDFVSSEEMESIFAATGERNQIRKKLISRMNEFLNSIPLKNIDEINEYFLPFYFGKFLVVYPFKNLLSSFGCSMADLVEFRSPDFKSADFSLVVTRLEQLLYCLNLFSITDWTDEHVNAVAGAYLRIKRSGEGENSEDKLQHIRKDIQTLKGGVEEFMRKTPMADIIRYIKKDCYYEQLFQVPKPDFFEFYRSSLKLRVLSVLASVFRDVQRRFINTSIERIFQGFSLYQLQGYREYKDFDFRILNLPYFKHISSLMLLYNFYAQYYKENVLEVFQLLYKTVLLKNPQLQSRIHDLLKDVDKISGEINAFDKSLLSDHEDGKTFSLLKNELKKSPALERKYRSFISEKDLEAEKLIFSGIEVLGHIEKSLERIISSPADLIRLQLSSVYPLVDRERSLRELIKMLLSDVSNLSMLIKQNLEMEKI